ncbi:NAD(P)-dependent oxidoreductase [Kocuria massiliensis]|uniref:NAD(P)-dependent oxidoreductase n=1 Tax=Kocuria massiliensis TaxID=1926282 RepID=UPI0022B99196|nr:NAD(P)-dependent oxidoreductase [Kocuria massiliensis]
MPKSTPAASSFPRPSANLARIGVVGLGHMGSPMAGHLASAFPGRVAVTARRRRSAEAAVEAGAKWVDSPRELAARSDVIVSVLPDLPELRSMLDELLAGAEGHRLVLVIASTSSPTEVRELARELAEGQHDAVVLDAPVSGGEDGARAGNLSIMLGGDPDDARLVAELLEPCGRAVRLGPVGAGQVAKACNQLIVSATVTAVSEAAILADRSGLDVSALFEVFAGGYAGSRILATRGERIATEDYSPSGAAKYLAKDLRFATDVATDTGSSLVLLPHLRQAFADLEDRGLGDLDLCVIRRYLELGDS